MSDVIEVLARTVREQLPAEMLPQAEEHIKWMPGQKWFPARNRPTHEERVVVYTRMAQIAKMLHDSVGPSDQAILYRWYVTCAFDHANSKEYQRRAAKAAGWV